MEAPPGTTTAGRLPRAHLSLAVADLVLRRVNAADAVAALWREDPETVMELHDRLFLSLSLDINGPADGRHGLRAEHLRKLRRPLPFRRKHGFTLNEVAERAGVSREVVASAMEHHGYLELVPFGGTQRRRLLTDQAFHAGIGHNVDAAQVRLGLEGCNRTSAYPVIYPERVADVLWTLDLDGIRATAAGLERKRQRLDWLMHHHAYLPDAFLADLAGCAVRTVERRRAEAEMSGGSYRSPVMQPPGGEGPHAALLW